MKTFLQPLMALVFLGLVRSADLAIGPVLPRVFWTICYGIAFIFLLLVVVIAAFGV